MAAVRFGSQEGCVLSSLLGDKLVRNLRLSSVFKGGTKNLS